MKKTLATLLILAPLVGQTQAALVFGGDFQLYKPGTGYTVTATLAAGNYGKGVGDGITLEGGGTATYNDGSGTGTVVDLPGWSDLGTGSLNDFADSSGDPNGGPDGSVALNLFGGWSGGLGQLVESSTGLTPPILGAGEVFQISADIIGDAGTMVFDLTVDGVIIAPDSQYIPSAAVWDVMTSTYSSLPAGVVKIRMGTDPAAGPLVGARTRVDNVHFSAVPEPSSALLLGLGGLALLRRKRN